MDKVYSYGGFFMRKHKKSIWLSGTVSLVLSSCIGLAVSLSCTALFSLLIRFLLKDMGLAGVFVSASLIAGAFTGSYICGRYHRHKGILMGALCGTAMFAVLSAIGLLTGGHTAGIGKLFLLAVSGMTGGVYGVNSKRPRNLL